MWKAEFGPARLNVIALQTFPSGENAQTRESRMAESFLFHRDEHTILELHLDLRDASIRDLDRNENITKDLKVIRISCAGFSAALLSRRTIHPR
jgi:hypothetical protein